MSSDTAFLVARIQTYHGTTVGIDPARRLLAHGWKVESIPLIGTRCGGARWAFMAADGQPFLVNLGPVRRHATSLQVTEHYQAAGGFALEDMLLCMYLSASPDGDIVVNRKQVLNWECFRIVGAKPSANEPVFARLRRLNFRGHQGVNREEDISQEDLEFDAAFADDAQFAASVQAIESKPNFHGWDENVPDGCDVWASSLSKAPPADISVAGDGARRLVLPTTLDYLANLNPEGQTVSVGHAISILKRSRIRPSKTWCILTSVRNEGPYLLDWIAYHRAIGAGEIFIYSNDNDDGSDELLGRLDDAGIVTWIQSKVGPGYSPQYKAYGHAFGLLPEIMQYRWALVIDLDEFLVLEAGPEDLSARLDHHAKAGVSCIGIDWFIFGSSGNSRYADEPVPLRFDRWRPSEPSLRKAFVQPHGTIHSQCHFPWQGRFSSRIWVDASGQPIPAAEISAAGFTAQAVAHHSRSLDPVRRNFWINHFYYKSTEEFIARRTQNSGDQGVSNTAVISSELAKRFEDQFVGHSMEDTAIAPAMGAMGSHKAKLVRLPGVEEAHRTVVDAYRRRIAEKLAANRDSNDETLRHLLATCM